MVEEIAKEDEPEPSSFSTTLLTIGTIAAVLVAIAGWFATQLQLFSEQPTEKDNHRFEIWVLSAILIWGSCSIAAWFTRGRKDGAIGIVVAPLALLAIIIFSVLFASKEAKIQERNEDVSKSFETFELPSTYTLVDQTSRPVGLDSNQDDGYIAKIFTFPNEPAVAFEELHTMIISNNGKPIASNCDQLTRRYFYSLPKNRLLELDFSNFLSARSTRETAKLWIRYTASSSTPSFYNDPPECPGFLN